ncbi:MAG: IS1595 family transposase [Gammaproteobacteria bacterium]|nr:IS1595 family transposase [Gammaproteobacteria bacterium]
MSKAPEESNRDGITLVQTMDMFPDEETAVKWFEDCVWPLGNRTCPKCDGYQTKEVPNAKPMPYWCKSCRSYFSVRTGTPIACSNIPMRKWAIGIYLCVTSLKPVSSMKLHRDLGITQASAWFMIHRIREAWAGKDDDPFDSLVEIDETFFGGKQKNKSNSERAELTGCGTVDQTAIVGAKCRESNEVVAKVVSDAKIKT